MTRPSIPAGSASPDAVTLAPTTDPTARDGASGRVLAQLEHNAMLALGMVRASMTALQNATHALENIAQVLPQSSSIEPARARELRRLIDELARHVQTAEHAGQSLLLGATVPFALDDPWLEASELLHLELPQLKDSVLAPDGIASLDLSQRANQLSAMHHVNAVRAAIARGHVSLQRGTRQLNVVLMRLNANRNKSTPPPLGPDDRDFEQLTGRVRDHVLRSGASALRVQGTPSVRAASLVEGSGSEEPL
jgi:hypothetical protein